MEYRLLKKSDAAQLQQLRLHALRTEPTAFTADYEEQKDWPLSVFAERIHETAENFIVGAFEQENLVGMGGFRREPGQKVAHKGIIWGMFVHEDYRSKGVGAIILDNIIAHARQLPELEQVQLAVMATNLPARNLYLSRGFEVYGYEKAAMKIAGQYYDDEQMVLFFN